jgi:plastocyanin
MSVFTDPKTIVVKCDSDTGHFFNLEEEQDERHAFTIASPYNIDEDLAGGESSDVTFTADCQGVFKYYCKYHQPAKRGHLVEREDSNLGYSLPSFIALKAFVLP